MTHYSDDLTGPGWVVAMRTTHTRSDGSKFQDVSWWYGEDRVWSNTWGGLGYSIAVFDSKVKARLALRRSGTRGTIQTLEEARLEQAAMLERSALATLDRVHLLRGETPRSSCCAPELCPTHYRETLDEDLLPTLEHAREATTIHPLEDED